MSSFKKISAGVALALACAATVAQAAPMLTVTPTYTETRRLASHPLGSAVLGVVDLTNTQYSGSNYAHKMELKFSISGIGAGDDFGGMSINVDNLGSALTKFTNWTTIPNVQVKVGEDDFGEPINNSLYSQNADSGTAADLQAVLFLTTGDVAKALQVGEASSFSIGSFFVKWNGTATSLKTSSAAGNFLNVFANNPGTASYGATSFTLANAGFTSGEVQFGPTGTTPSIVALLSSGPASNPNLPDVPYQYTETNQAIIDLPVGTTKAEIQFLPVIPVPSGSLYAMFWLDGTPADVAAFLAAAQGTLTGGGVMVTSGGIYDSLRNNFPGVDLVLQYPGQAPALNGGSLAFDFSNNGSVVVTQFAAVPEPASLLSLGGLSFLGFMLGRRRR